MTPTPHLTPHWGMGWGLVAPSGNLGDTDDTRFGALFVGVRWESSDLRWRGHLTPTQGGGVKVEPMGWGGGLLTPTQITQ